VRVRRGLPLGVLRGLWTVRKRHLGAPSLDVQKTRVDDLVTTAWRAIVSQAGA